jgi:hypothetical protein
MNIEAVRKIIRSITELGMGLLALALEHLRRRGSALPSSSSSSTLSIPYTFFSFILRAKHKFIDEFIYKIMNSPTHHES